MGHPIYRHREAASLPLVALLSISPVLYPDLEFLDVYLYERYIPSFVRFEVITAVFLDIKSSEMLCTLTG